MAFQKGDRLKQVGIRAPYRFFLGCENIYGCLVLSQIDSSQIFH